MLSTLLVVGLILTRRLGWPRFSPLLLPCMFRVFHYALLNLTFTALRHGGIRWRETFYPLKDLRACNVR